MCRSHLIDAAPSTPVKVFVDLAQFPFAAILNSLKATNPLSAVISLPFIALIYVFKKILRQPFNAPLFTGQDPKFHLIELEAFKRLHRKSFQKVATFLKQLGFEPLITLEDKSMVQAIFQDIWVNHQQNLYATIHINKAIGKVIYTAFSAFTSGNTYFSVDNTYAISIRYPKNLIVHHLPKASPDTIFQKLLDLIRQHNKAPRLLSLPALLSTGTKIQQFSIQQGFKQKLLCTRLKGHPGVTTCYHHPVNMAVRICAICHMHVCETCYESYQEKYYCKNCLPQISKDNCQSTTPAAGPQAEFAGLGVRMVSWLLDSVIIGAIIAAIYMGLNHGITLLTRLENYSSLPFILTQLIFMVMVPFYFIAPIKHKGQTPGMRMLGLRVVDQQGRVPDGVATLVRFAYFLFSCFFIFPLIGYLFVIFRKSKQGLHDQLADTLVVTNHSIKKAIVSWSVLLTVLAISAGYTLQWAKPWMDIFRSFSAGAIASEVTLEANWVLPFEEEHQFLYSFVRRGERLILTSPTTAQAMNIRTGDVTWTNNRLLNSEIQVSSANESLPLLMLQFSGSGFPHMLNIDSESGEIFWKRELETKEPVLLFDAETILIYDINQLWAYSTSNQLLWVKSFSDKFGIENVVLNRDILVACTFEETRNLFYLSRTSGNILWEATDPEYETGYSLGQGYQFLYTNEGKSNLMFLPEQRLEWISPQSVGYAVAGSPEFVTDLNIPEDILFTTTSAVRSKDGTVLYSYPAGARYGCLSNSFLILIKGDTAETSQASIGELLVLDKRTGSTQKIFAGKEVFSITTVAEDPTHIYFMANHHPDRQNAFKAVSELLILDKNSFTLEEIPVGKNIALHQIKIFPREHLIFIPTHQHVGTYHLPKKTEHAAAMAEIGN